MKSVAIVGASGYTGRELLRLLERHEHLSAGVVMSSRPEGSTDQGRTLEPLNAARFADVDGVFLCTPHGMTSALAQAAVQTGRPVVDLSADFRLRDKDAFAAIYGQEHQAPELLADAVYGLTEHNREAIASAKLVANPGCYPTSILLPLLPLTQHDLLASDSPIIADSKSGVSGAGKQAKDRTHFGNVHDNFLAYGIGTHRHAPEIAQELGQSIVFTPHLLPTFRGILSTIYVTPQPGVTAATIRSCLTEQYGQEPNVSVYQDGTPELHNVQLTNQCHIAVHDSGPLVVITSAIDNLVKGASGQALQNMNLMLGFAETEGLT